MKIKDTLDLCGWELWNFCIQNHQNLEGLLDLGAGRKVFYTGNDQGKNGREVIYDGSKWKVSAYTSDVDELRGLITALESATDEEIEALKGRATTTEGNLATLRSEFDALNKALNDDTAGVIDTWSEVVDFVNEYSGSEDLSTILAGMNTQIADRYTKAEADNRYLKLTGGKIIGNLAITSHFSVGETATIGGRLTMKGLIAFDQYNETGKTYLLGMTNAGSPLQWYDNTQWNTLLHSGNYSDLITTLNNNLNVPSITIGGIRLSVENGLLKIEGSAFATGELAAGGAGTEGNGGAGGFSLYESWGTSAPTEPLALGANLGYELKTRVEDLELAKTKVTFEPALVSGKQIGTITIDGNKTNLFAPATYAWSEITSKPTTLAGYGITDALSTAGGAINGYLYIGSAENTSYYPIVLRRYGKLAELANSGAAAVMSFNDGASVGSLKITTSNITFNDKDILTSAGGTISGIVDFTSTGYLRHKIESFASGTGGWVKNMLTIADANWTTKGYISVYGNGDKLNYIYVGCNTYDGVNLRVGKDLLQWGDNPILHSGNVGDYKAGDSNKLGGQVPSYYVGQHRDVSQTLDANTVTQNHITHGSKWSNTPTIDIMSLLDMAYSEDWRTQIIARPYNQCIWARFYYNGTTWSDWKTIAFTDSTVEAAYKLKNPANNNDVLTVASNGTLKCLGWGIGEVTDKWTLSTAGYIGNVQDTLSDAVELRSPKGIVLATNKISLIINSSGYVTIGASDLAGTNDKLFVDGRTSSKGYIFHHLNDTVENKGAFLMQYFSSSSSDVLVLSSRNKDYSAKRSILAVDWAKGNLLVGTTNDNGSDAVLQVAGEASVSSLAVSGTSTFNGASNFYGSTTFNAQSVFNAPVIIKDKNTLQIGDAVLMWDKEKKVLTVDKSFASMGEISAGGTGTEGGNTGGGGTGTITNPDVEYYNPKDNATHTFYHNLPYYDVVVQVYEKNAISGAWDMILADVTIANESNLVTVNFGRKEDVEHKIVVR